MGVINSPLVEGGVFSEEVNKKEVTVNGVNSNKKSVRITIILHTLFAIISLLLYIVSYTVLWAAVNGSDESSGIKSKIFR